MYHYVTNLAMNLNTDAFELKPLEITIGVCKVLFAVSFGYA